MTISIPLVSLSDELQAASLRGEWCGWCKSGVCESCGGTLPCMKYEPHSLSWREDERVSEPEEEEDPFEGFQYEDRHQVRIPRIRRRLLFRPQRG
jgi:hypothetical protein